IGTGFGVCVVRDGGPVGRGVVGGGILGGQIPISEATDGPVDTSGRPDSIEAFCRADRIVAEAGSRFSSVQEVFEAHRSGDQDASAALDRYRRHLARAVAALAHAHAPEVVVLGGGPMTEDTPILDGLQQLVDERAWPGYSVEVRRASLGDAAALAGLAHLSR
ncbi:MAG TPA: ROK family protein, partial [Actinomycetota bacterium]|nr:ROK family protein [Actinomycetota bacterium]